MRDDVSSEPHALGDRIALEGVRIIARLFAVERDSTCAGDGAEQL
jgi:hypothetical protein